MFNSIDGNNLFETFEMSSKLEQIELKNVCLEILNAKAITNIINKLSENAFECILKILNEYQIQSQAQYKYMQCKRISDIIRDYSEQNYQQESIKNEKLSNFFKIAVSSDDGYELNNEILLKPYSNSIKEYLLGLNDKNEKLFKENEGLKNTIKEIKYEQNKQISNARDIKHQLQEIQEETVTEISYLKYLIKHKLKKIKAEAKTIKPGFNKDEVKTIEPGFDKVETVLKKYITDLKQEVALMKQEPKIDKKMYVNKIIGALKNDLKPLFDENLLKSFGNLSISSPENSNKILLTFPNSNDIISKKSPIQVLVAPKSNKIIVNYLNKELIEVLIAPNLNQSIANVSNKMQIDDKNESISSDYSEEISGLENIYEAVSKEDRIDFDRIPSNIQSTDDILSNIPIEINVKYGKNMIKLPSIAKFDPFKEDKIQEYSQLLQNREEEKGSDSSNHIYKSEIIFENELKPSKRQYIIKKYSLKDDYPFFDKIKPLDMYPSALLYEIISRCFRIKPLIASEEISKIPPLFNADLILDEEKICCARAGTKKLAQAAASLLGLKILYPSFYEKYMQINNKNKEIQKVLSIVKDD